MDKAKNWIIGTLTAAVVAAVAAALLLRESPVGSSTSPPTRQPSDSGDGAASYEHQIVADAPVDGVRRVSPTSTWEAKYRNSTDYFAFAKSSARAAFEGDAEAQHYILRALRECETVARQYRGKDAEVKIQNFTPALTQRLRDQLLRTYRRCARFIDEDAFAGLPAREGGYTARYWLGRSLESSHPITSAWQASSEAPLITSASKEEQPRLLSKIEAYVSNAIESENPEAIYIVGFTIMSLSNNDADKRRAIAWMLLACDKGYDCSSANPENILVQCNDTGSSECPTSADVKYYLQQSVDGAVYASAYALAEELKMKLAQGDLRDVLKLASFPLR